MLLFIWPSDRIVLTWILKIVFQLEILNNIELIFKESIVGLNSAVLGGKAAQY